MIAALILVVIAGITVTQASEMCQKGRIQAAYEELTTHWNQSQDYSTLIQSLAEFIQLSSQFTNECLQFDAVRTLEKQRKCENRHFSLTNFPIQQLISVGEIMKSIEVKKTETGEIYLNDVLIESPEIPPKVTLTEKFGCFADCESSFIELYARAKSAVIDITSSPKNVFPDLLLTLLQLGTVVSTCAAYIF